MGAWIETEEIREHSESKTVAPYVGAWIETVVEELKQARAKRRTLRGCVD